MKPAGLIKKSATTKRILSAGFDALAEYDRGGNLVAAQGTLSSQYAWERVAEIAFSRAGRAAEERATSYLLGELIVAALDLEGGGTFLAIVERPVIEASAEQLACSLDAAVADYIGPVPAPLVALGAVLIVAVVLLS